MNVLDIYGSKYLTAHDLGGKSYTLTIRKVTLEEMRTHDNTVVKKMCIWFDGANKALVANRTNAMTIAALYGNETDLWVGKRIILFPTQVRAFGSMQDCIRVRQEIPAKPAPATAAAAAEETAGLDDDDDLTDLPDEGDLWEPDLSHHTPNAKRRKERIGPAQLERLQTLLLVYYGKSWEEQAPKLCMGASKGSAGRLEDLILVEYEVLAAGLERRIAEAQATEQEAPV